MGEIHQDQHKHLWGKLYPVQSNHITHSFQPQQCDTSSHQALSSVMTQGTQIIFCFKRSVLCVIMELLGIVQLQGRGCDHFGMAEGISDRRNGKKKQLLPSPDKADDKAGIPLKMQVVEAAELVNIDTGQQGRILIHWTLSLELAKKSPRALTVVIAFVLFHLCKGITLLVTAWL